jgi:hypothetical protein
MHSQSQSRIHGAAEEAGGNYLCAMHMQKGRGQKKANQPQYENNTVNISIECQEYVSRNSGIPNPLLRFKPAKLGCFVIGAS